MTKRVMVATFLSGSGIKQELCRIGADDLDPVGRAGDSFIPGDVLLAKLAKSDFAEFNIGEDDRIQFNFMLSDTPDVTPHTKLVAGPRAKQTTPGEAVAGRARTRGKNGHRWFEACGNCKGEGFMKDNPDDCCPVCRGSGSRVVRIVNNTYPTGEFFHEGDAKVVRWEEGNRAVVIFPNQGDSGHYTRVIDPEAQADDAELRDYIGKCNLRGTDPEDLITRLPPHDRPFVDNDGKVIYPLGRDCYLWMPPPDSDAEPVFSDKAELPEALKPTPSDTTPPEGWTRGRLFISDPKAEHSPDMSAILFVRSSELRPGRFERALVDDIAEIPSLVTQGIVYAVDIWADDDAEAA